MIAASALPATHGDVTMPSVADEDRDVCGRLAVALDGALASGLLERAVFFGVPRAVELETPPKVDQPESTAWQEAAPRSPFSLGRLPGRSARLSAESSSVTESLPLSEWAAPSVRHTQARSSFAMSSAGGSRRTSAALPDQSAPAALHSRSPSERGREVAFDSEGPCFGLSNQSANEIPMGPAQSACFGLSNQSANEIPMGPAQSANEIPMGAEASFGKPFREASPSENVSLASSARFGSLSSDLAQDCQSAQHIAPRPSLGATRIMFTSDGPSEEWTLDNTALLCENGEEACFHGKARLFSDFTSVSEVVRNFNDEPNLCPEGFGVVHSTQHSKYFVVYKEHKKTEVFRLFNLNAASSLEEYVKDAPTNCPSSRRCSAEVTQPSLPLDLTLPIFAKNVSSEDTSPMLSMEPTPTLGMEATQATDVCLPSRPKKSFVVMNPFDDKSPTKTQVPARVNGFGTLPLDQTICSSSRRCSAEETQPSLPAQLTLPIFAKNGSSEDTLPILSMEATPTLGMETTQTTEVNLHSRPKKSFAVMNPFDDKSPVSAHVNGFGLDPTVPIDFRLLQGVDSSLVGKQSEGEHGSPDDSSTPETVLLPITGVWNVCGDGHEATSPETVLLPVTGVWNVCGDGNAAASTETVMLPVTGVWNVCGDGNAAASTETVMLPVTGVWNVCGDGSKSMEATLVDDALDATRKLGAIDTILDSALENKATSTMLAAPDGETARKLGGIDISQESVMAHRSESLTYDAFDAEISRKLGSIDIGQDAVVRNMSANWVPNASNGDNALARSFATNCGSKVISSISPQRLAQPVPQIHVMRSASPLRIATSGGSSPPPVQISVTPSRSVSPVIIRQQTRIAGCEESCNQSSLHAACRAEPQDRHQVQLATNRGIACSSPSRLQGSAKLPQKSAPSYTAKAQALRQDRQTNIPPPALTPPCNAALPSGSNLTARRQPSKEMWRACSPSREASTPRASGQPVRFVSPSVSRQSTMPSRQRRVRSPTNGSPTRHRTAQSPGAHGQFDVAGPSAGFAFVAPSSSPSSARAPVARSPRSPSGSLRAATAADLNPFGTCSLRAQPNSDCGSSASGSAMAPPSQAVGKRPKIVASKILSSSCVDGDAEQRRVLVSTKVLGAADGSPVKGTFVGAPLAGAPMRRPHSAGALASTAASTPMRLASSPLASSSLASTSRPGSAQSVAGKRQTPRHVPKAGPKRT